MGWTEEAEMWLLRLSGLPISASPGPPTLRQIAVTASCICGYTFIVAIYMYNIIQDENDSPYLLYLRLHWVIYPTVAALVTLNMAWQSRCAPIRLSERVKYMRELMKANQLGLRATNICRMASKVLLVTTLISICFICIKDAIDLYVIFGLFTPTSGYLVLSALLIILNQPSIILLWVVLYLSAAQPLAELGFIEDVMHAMSEHVPEQDFIEDVMPALPQRVPEQGFIEDVIIALPEHVPEQGFIEDVMRALPDHAPQRGLSVTLPPMVGDQEEEGSGCSRIQCNAQKLTHHRYRTLLEICRQINKLRLESNRWMHFPSCMVMFSVAWYLPVLMSGLSKPQGSFFYKSVSWIYTTVGTLGKLAPLICAQWVKYRREVLVQKVAREIAKTSDPDLKRILTKLLLNAQDKFPDSACYLLDFDLSLFPVLLDMVVLATTTFLN